MSPENDRELTAETAKSRQISKLPYNTLGIKIMKRFNSKEIAQAWITFQSNWWAHEQAVTTCEQHPQKAWAFLKHLIELADTKELLEDIGSGPLEDFIRAHATAYIKRIEELAAKDTRFRKTLRHVWINEQNEDVRNRLVKLGCIPLKNDQ